MTTRRWVIRHRKTDIKVGEADLEIPYDRMGAGSFDSVYYFAIMPPIADMWKGIDTVEVGGPELFARKVAVWIRPRHPAGHYTLWVEKASELVGMSTFRSSSLADDDIG